MNKIETFVANRTVSILDEFYLAVRNSYIKNYKDNVEEDETMFIVYNGFISDINGCHSIYGSKTSLGDNITKEFLIWEKIWMP